MPSVQQSLYLNEATNGNAVMKTGVLETRDVFKRCMTTCGRAAGTRAKMRSRARKEASAQKVRGYYKQFAEAQHLEYRSWVHDKVFDLVDLRKFNPKNYVCNSTIGAHYQDRHARQFPQSKGQIGKKRILDKQKECLQTDSPAST